MKVRYSTEECVCVRVLSLFVESLSPSRSHRQDLYVNVGNSNNESVVNPNRFLLWIWQSRCTVRRKCKWQ
jgi:hypothetical protein